MGCVLRKTVLSFVSPFVSPGWVKMRTFVITREDLTIIQRVRLQRFATTDDISGFVQKCRFALGNLRSIR